MIKPLLIAASVLTFFSGQAQNLLKNGSFEQFAGTTCVTPGAGCTPCYACATNTVLPFWHVDAGNLDIFKKGQISNSNLAAGVPQGDFGLDMNGTLPATMSQEVSNMVPNSPYVLTFFYSNNNINTQYCNMDKPFQVNVYDASNAIIATSTVSTAGLSGRNNVWAQGSLNFIPSTNFAKIEFKSLFGANGFVSGCGFGADGATGPWVIYGPTLDSVYLDGLIALPLQLLSFNGTYTASGLNLKWKTADEESLVKTIVEFDNGTKWEEVGAVPAVGNRGSNNYSITIPAATVKHAPQLSLRLKMVSADKVTYSNALYLQYKSSKLNVSIFPNPVTKNFLNVVGLKGGETIMVHNASGQLLITQKAGSAATQTVDLASMGAGMYSLTVLDKSGAKETLKFVKSE